MKRTLSSLALAGAVFAVLAGSSHEAKADTRIFFGFGSPAPIVYAPPRVVYVRPQPVYYRPAPVYYAPPAQYVSYYPSYYYPRGWGNHRDRHDDDDNHGHWHDNGHHNWR